LPDVSLSLSSTIESEADKPFSLDEKEVDYLAGLSIDIPLNQHDEEVAVRQAQINLLKAKRAFREARDNVVISVRSALRNIEVYQFSYDLQERNVGIAQLGLDSINADPDRVSVLDQTRAIQDLQSAQNARDSARRDLELSIVDYLLQAGQLRITNVGGLQLPLSENNLTIEE
ncbi:MAG: TolC family protein, partial [Phycisphaerales bacterium]|nr:TolC family protein [Phycisphaerales bacterium]